MDIRLKVFGKDNLHLATALEDLAYSTYVNEYSTGRFDTARFVLKSTSDNMHRFVLQMLLLNVMFRGHAEDSINMITRILPNDHLSLASSKRVKGTFRSSL